jgi:TonB family protein
MKYQYFICLFFLFFLQKNSHAQNDFLIVKNKGKSDTIFYKTEKNILYNIGNQALVDSLAQLLTYPVIARSNQVSGKINLAFIVSKNGLARDAYSADSLESNLFVKESLKKINFFLKNHRLDWQTATNKGKRVNAIFAFKISFLAEKKEKSVEHSFVTNSKDTIVVSCDNNTFFAKKIITTQDSLIGEVYDNNKVEVGASLGSDRNDLGRWLSTSIVYPAWAREKNIKGKVVVRFEIDENGKAGNPIIVSDTAEILNQEVLRLVSIMPKWTPAKHHGRNVKVYVLMPANFKLEG